MICELNETLCSFFYDLAKPEVLFSGLGVFLISLIPAFYFYKKKHNVEISVSKNSTLVDDDFKKISIRDKALSLDSYFLPIKSIAHMSISKEDVRSDFDKKYFKRKDDIDGTVMVLFLLALAGVLCIVSLVYLGIESALSYLGIDGLVENENQSKYVDMSIFYLVLAIIAFAIYSLKQMLNSKIGVPVWMWKLSITTSDDTIFLIKSTNDKIENLKKSIEMILQGGSEEIVLSLKKFRGALHEESLVDAFERNYISFGSTETLNGANAASKKNSSIGDWVVNGDGTVTDSLHGLMWIQASWGMIWNGGKYIGNSIDLPWSDAKKLFGEGVFTGKTEYGTLSMEQLNNISFDHGYTSGACRIHFAEFSDWRLPTADEWKTIQFNSSRYSYPDMKSEDRERYLETLFPNIDHHRRYWTATGKWHPYMSEFEDISSLSGIHKLLARIEVIATKLYKTFSSDRFFESMYTAWSCNFSGNLDQDGEMEFPVLFVRKL